MAANQTASSTTVFGGIKTTVPGSRNTQIIPLQRVQHFSPANVGAVASGVTSYQLLAGAVTGAPSAGVTWTMPTAANLLNAYAGNQLRVNPGDVFKVLVLNTGTAAMTFNSSAVTGVTGALVAGFGSTTPPGAETPLHINWLQVSADGTTGAYQIY